MKRISIGTLPMAQSTQKEVINLRSELNSYKKRSETTIQQLESLNVELENKINRIKLKHGDELEKVARRYMFEIDEAKEARNTLERKNKLLNDTIKGLKTLVLEMQETQKGDESDCRYVSRREDSLERRDYPKRDKLEYKSEGIHHNVSTNKSTKDDFESNQSMKSKLDEFQHKILQLEQENQAKNKKIGILENQLQSVHQSQSRKEASVKPEELDKHLQKLFNELKKTQQALENNKLISPINSIDHKQHSKERSNTPSRNTMSYSSNEIQKATTEQTMDRLHPNINLISPERIPVSPLRSELDPSQISPRYRKQNGIKKTHPLMMKTTDDRIDNNITICSYSEDDRDYSLPLETLIRLETDRSVSRKNEDVLALTQKLVKLQKKLDSKNKIILQQQRNLELSNHLAFKVSGTLEEIGGENHHLKLLNRNYKNSIVELEERVMAMSSVIKDLKRQLERSGFSRAIISEKKKANMMQNGMKANYKNKGYHDSEDFQRISSTTYGYYDGRSTEMGDQENLSRRRGYF